MSIYYRDPPPHPFRLKSPMSTDSPLNGELNSSHNPRYNRRTPAVLKKPSYSQFPVPPGAPPWQANPPQHSITRRRTMEDRNGERTNGRVSPYTLSVAAEFSLKRANRQLLAMGETLENAKSDLSPTGILTPGSFRTHSRSSSAPISPVTSAVPRNADGYSGSGDMLGDMRKLAIELRTLRESIDPARRGSISSIGSTSRGSTPLTSPRSHSQLREASLETPRTTPRHSRHSSASGLQTLREEQPVIEVQTMRGSAMGQPSAVVRIFRSTPNQVSKDYHRPTHPNSHYRSLSDSNGIHIRQYDHRGRETYSSRIGQDPYSPKWKTEDRPESEQSMLSESSYHTAVHTMDVEYEANGHISDHTSDHISDTATIGRPPTPVTEVRSIGVNTEDVLPAEIIPPQQLRQRPSRAALLSNIRGCQDGMLIARLHSAVDKLAVKLASTPSQNTPEDVNAKRKLQAALDLLEEV
jgi:hypothetical protein